LAPNRANFATRDFAGREKIRQLRAFLSSLANQTEYPECLAGDAVLIALVSGAIPCKQGI
jgi:hypothetical protein